MVEDFFNKKYFEEFFLSHLSFKMGGGRDKIKPIVYWNVYSKEVDSIISKCLSGNFNFSPYNEHLVSKGSKSLPRVISIPIVRDRWVLGVLNQYLSELFPECVNHHTPNSYIKDIQHFIEEHKGKQIQFFKSDFEKFYDNINQDVLLSKLKSKIQDIHILDLIRKAIQTPTYSDKKDKKGPNLKGVPQGLAISNILAAIYMYDFDRFMESETADGIYKRYVDDILVFMTSVDGLNSRMTKFNEEQKLELKFSDSKTVFGDFQGAKVDYIGFIISEQCISPRSKNIDSFLNRLASKCTKFRTLYEHKHLRPPFIEKDEVLKSYYIEELNMQISGIKIENHLYGWMPYFQAITDLSLLYRIDKIIKKKYLKPFGADVTDKVNSIVTSYYSIIQHNGKHLTFDYDAIKSPTQMQFYLTRRGLLQPERKYTIRQIESMFVAHKEKVKRKTQKNIGYSN